MIKSVLVVEDDELLASRYSLFLRSQGVDVCCAHSLAQARSELAHLLTLDAVVLDNHLADGNGLALLPVIKKQFIDCPVIMVSAETDPEYLIDAFAEGIDGYVIKPVNLDLLWLKLNKSRDSFRLKRLNEQQQKKLEAWIDQEKREHELARHVFDSLIGRVEVEQQHLRVCSRSSSAFCGDLVLQQTGLDGTYYLMLADSMGHGLAAAIALLPVIEVFQAMSRKGLGLSHLVFELNEKLLRQLPMDRFVAAVFIRVDPKLQQIQIWNGGMPPLFLLDESGVVLAEAPSRHMALGILSEQQLDLNCQVVNLAAVARIIGYTDGLTDNSGDTDVQLDRATILALCLKNPDMTGFVQYLAQMATLQDDMTIFNLWLPALTQLQQDTVATQTREGTLGLSLKLEGKMLQCSDAGNQIVRILQVCDMPQSLCTKTFAVLTELFLNAFEHGVLGLNSQLKQQDNGFLQYYEEKERRLAQLADSDVIEIELQWRASLSEVAIKVKDSGAGFLPQQTPVQGDQQLSGRGMTLIRSLCSEVEYLGNGNEVRVVINR